jgi:hypothetical protein
LASNKQAVEVLNKEKPPSGNYPNGSFQSSQTVDPSYFNHDAASAQEELISQVHMPFLFNMIMGTLQPSNEADNDDHHDDSPAEIILQDPAKQELFELVELEYQPVATAPCRFKKVISLLILYPSKFIQTNILCFNKDCSNHLLNGCICKEQAMQWITAIQQHSLHSWRCLGAYKRLLAFNRLNLFSSNGSQSSYLFIKPCFWCFERCNVYQ